jgi:MerR family Zn(II)-responsive transcriptional regulator of zntA
MRPSYFKPYISYVIMILIAVQSVFFSLEELEVNLIESSFNTSLTESITPLESPETSNLFEVSNSQTLIDNCNFCCCCHLFLNADYSCNILQKIEYFLTYALVSPELKGYMSVPFRPPKYA